MKNTFFRAAGVAFAMLATTTFSCQREAILEDQAQPDAQLATIPTPPYCGTTADYGLVTSYGAFQVDFCATGPCTTTDPWGVVTLGNTVTDAITAIQMVPGYYIQQYYVFVGDCQNLTYSPDGKPLVTSDWAPYPQGPYGNGVVHYTPSAGLPDCYCTAVRVDAVRLSFFGQPVAGSERTLYLYSTGNTFSYSAQRCDWECVTTLTAGSCSGCDSENTVTFYNCSSVDVSSCRNISKVTVVYDDCTSAQYNGVGLGGSFSAPAGRTISHVFVKSGCNGANPGRRFDGPCLNPGC